MGVFEYRAINLSGEMLVGTMEGASPAEVLQHLDKAGFTPISAREAHAGDKRTWRERLTPEPKPEEITGFTMDLAMLLKGGVALNEALLILAQMDKRRWLVRLVHALHLDLSSGKSLSKALSEHPRLFPPIYVKMTEVAEVSGRLEEALTSIANERQRNDRLRKRLVGAVAYPGFLAVASLGVLSFMLLYIIPQFEGAIAGFRDRMDPSSLLVFDMSEWFRANIDIVVIAIAGLLAAFMAANRIGRKRNLWIAFLSKLPFTGRVVTYNMTLIFCRTLAILMENGVDISTSLRLIRGVVNVPGAQEKIDAVIGDVRGGGHLAQALGRHALLLPHVVQMLRIGEESGNLTGSAQRVATFYEARLDTALTRLTAVLGPVLMIGVSVLIGWLIISIMTALMSINDLVI